MFQDDEQFEPTGERTCSKPRRSNPEERSTRIPAKKRTPNGARPKGAAPQIAPPARVPGRLVPEVDAYAGSRRLLLP